MEWNETRLLEVWADQWRDLVESESVPVRRSREAVEIIAPEQ
jgi:hypothetical protein